MKARKTSRECGCGAVQDLVSDANCPIEHDADLNEYNIVSLDKHAGYRLYFCFFCGGRLPESRRDALYLEPSPKEVSEVTKLLGTVTSIEEARQVLGKPDKVSKLNSNGAGKQSSFDEKHHMYSSRWQTLDLTIRERADGFVDYAFAGKLKRRG